MAAGKWKMYEYAKEYLPDGTHDLDNTSLGYTMALFLSTSNAETLSVGTGVYGDLTNEHANANGYTTGGISLGALTLAGTTTVTVDDPADCVWTASGGSIVARFAVLYENAGDVVCYCLLDATPADVTATSGNTLTLALNASGIFTLA